MRRPGLEPGFRRWQRLVITTTLSAQCALQCGNSNNLSISKGRTVQERALLPLRPHGRRPQGLSFPPHQYMITEPVFPMSAIKTNAVYKDGTLVMDAPVNLPDQTRVEVVIRKKFSAFVRKFGEPEAKADPDHLLAKNRRRVRNGWYLLLRSVTSGSRRSPLPCRFSPVMLLPHSHRVPSNRRYSSRVTPTVFMLFRMIVTGTSSYRGITTARFAAGWWKTRWSPLWRMKVHPALSNILTCVFQSVGDILFTGHHVEPHQKNKPGRIITIPKGISVNYKTGIGIRISSKHTIFLPVFMTSPSRVYPDSLRSSSRVPSFAVSSSWIVMTSARFFRAPPAYGRSWRYRARGNTMCTSPPPSRFPQWWWDPAYLSPIHLYVRTC